MAVDKYLLSRLSKGGVLMKYGFLPTLSSCANTIGSLFNKVNDTGLALAGTPVTMVVVTVVAVA